MRDECINYKWAPLLKVICEGGLNNYKVQSSVLLLTAFRVCPTGILSKLTFQLSSLP